MMPEPIATGTGPVTTVTSKVDHHHGFLAHLALNRNSSCLTVTTKRSDLWRGTNVSLSLCAENFCHAVMPRKIVIRDMKLHVSLGNAIPNVLR